MLKGKFGPSCLDVWACQTERRVVFGVVSGVPEGTKFFCFVFMLAGCRSLLRSYGVLRIFAHDLALAEALLGQRLRVMATKTF